jgi:hypothetical protein
LAETWGKAEFKASRSETICLGVYYSENFPAFSCPTLPIFEHFCETCDNLRNFADSLDVSVEEKSTPRLVYDQVIHLERLAFHEVIDQDIELTVDGLIVDRERHGVAAAGGEWCHNDQTLRMSLAVLHREFL